MKKNLIKFVIFLFVFGCLGLFREYVFINTNNVIYFKYYKNTTMPIPFGFSWLTHFPYSFLYFIKYPLTILFVGIYFIANYTFLKMFKVYPVYLNILMVTYIIMIVLAGILMLYAYFFHQKLNEDEYSISRALMGLAQSPLISFVLFALYLWDKNKFNSHEKRNSNI